MSSETVSRMGPEVSVLVCGYFLPSLPSSARRLPTLGDGASTSLTRPAEKPATVIVTLK